MRSGKWKIASCGIVGLVLGHAAANNRLYGNSRFTFEEQNSSRAASDTFFSRPKTADAAAADASESPADAANAPQQPERYSRQKGAGTAQAGALKSSSTAPR